MGQIRLYLDEDVNPLPAASLRQRGHDASRVHELNRRGVADRKHFDYATIDDRTIMTFNIRDYVPG